MPRGETYPDWRTGMMNQLRHSRTLALIGAFSIAAFATPANAGSETPPPGAPWQRDFDQVQREALKTGKPIFVYFTKTY